MDILHAILDSVADTDVPIVNSIEEETRNLENLFLNFNHIERSDFLLVIFLRSNSRF
jgi:Mg2+ and Co2+ transporter CorA